MPPKRLKLQTLKPRVSLLAPRVTNTLRSELRRVYDSRQWRDYVRPTKIATDPSCQRCWYLGRRTPAAHVDHRTPLRQGGQPFDWANLVSLCTPCHSGKTMCEQTGEPFPDVAPGAPEPTGWVGVSR
jgi:5-methylcytosine-specific restriction endonuclease McrA